MNNGIFSVLACGARGDGTTLDSPAIQRAIDLAAAAGGRVMVPPGTYLCGTVRLCSRVTLELQQGATILGSPDLAHYETRTWGHHRDITPWHLILAEDAEDIAITGEGTIDGNGPTFWQPERPSEWHFWREKLERVSPMVHLQNCRRVRVENVRLTGSAGWTLHLHDCDACIVRGLQIHNTLFGPNTDGIDITGSHDVTISDCHISTGDDAIALKTSEYSRSCEDIVIANCVLETSCVAVRVGYESRKAFRRIAVSNCAVRGCSRVIDLRSVEGGDIEQVSVSGIVATTNSGWPINRPIEISLHRVDNVYKGGLHSGHPDYGKDKPVPRAGIIRGITLRDMDIMTDGRITVVADDGARIEGVSLQNVRLRYVLCDDPRPVAGSARGVGYLPGDHADARNACAAVVAKNVKGLIIRDLAVEWPEYPVPDTWHLLRSPQRMICRSVYEGHEEDIRTGRQRCPFQVLSAKRVQGTITTVGTPRASDGGEPFSLIECQLGSGPVAS